MTSSDATTVSSITSWFSGALPSEWTTAGPPSVTVDRDEITVSVSIEPPSLPDTASDTDVNEALAGRIAAFRDDTRSRRMDIARNAEHRFDRKVAWAVTCADRAELFAHLAAPVMTRLRQQERMVLDTLIDANVARSRADALAWCVRLVGEHAEQWIEELRTALLDVERIRAAGPDLS